MKLKSTGCQESVAAKLGERSGHEDDGSVRGKVTPLALAVPVMGFSA